MPETLALQARIAFLVDWNGPAAETRFRDSIRLAPSLSRTHQAYALLLMSHGRHNESVDEVIRARELDPLRLSTANDLGVVLYAGRRYPGALAETRRILQLAPQARSAHFPAGAILVASGQTQEARKVLNEMDRGPVSHTHQAILLLALGDRDKSLMALETAINRREFEALYLDAEPHLDSLRQDARFETLRRRVGLTP